MSSLTSYQAYMYIAMCICTSIYIYIYTYIYTYLYLFIDIYIYIYISISIYIYIYICVYIYTCIYIYIYTCIYIYIYTDTTYIDLTHCLFRAILCWDIASMSGIAQGSRTCLSCALLCCRAATKHQGREHIKYTAMKGLRSCNDWF